MENKTLTARCNWLKAPKTQINWNQHFADFLPLDTLICQAEKTHDGDYDLNCVNADTSAVSWIISSYRPIPGRSLSDRIWSTFGLVCGLGVALAGLVAFFS